jgi:hypothetical protein
VLLQSYPNDKDQSGDDADENSLIAAHFTSSDPSALHERPWFAFFDAPLGKARSHNNTFPA